jgi:hypothetical protein
MINTYKNRILILIVSLLIFNSQAFAMYPANNYETSFDFNKLLDVKEKNETTILQKVKNFFGTSDTDTKTKSNQTDKKISQNENTPEYISETYGVHAERETTKDILERQGRHTFETGLLLKGKTTYNEVTYTTDPNDSTKLIEEKEGKTVPRYGIALNGELDLMPISIKLNNIFANIAIANDDVTLGIEKRYYLNKNHTGPLLGISFGAIYPIKDTIRSSEDGTPLYYGARLGWSWKEYSLEYYLKFADDRDNLVPNSEQKIGVEEQIQFLINF